MTRKRWRWLGWLLVLGGLAVLTVWHLVQPERLGVWLVDQAAVRSGLQITTRSPASLRLRDGLQLGMQGLDVRMHGADTAIVQAEELALRMEWSVLWGESRVRGLDLWQPVLDQSALRAWMDIIDAAAEPESTEPGFALTELRALRVRSGSWQRDDGRIEKIDLDLEGFAQGETSVLDASIELPRDSSVLRLTLHLEGNDTDLSRGIAWPHWRSDVKLDDLEILQLEGSAVLLPADEIALDAELHVLNWPESALGAKPDWIGQFMTSSLQMRWPGPDDTHPMLTLIGEGSGHRLDAALAPAELVEWWSRDAWWQVPPLRLQARIDRLDIEGIELHGIKIDTKSDPSRDATSAEGEPDAH